MASDGPRRLGIPVSAAKGRRNGALSTLRVNSCQNPASARLHPQCACREIQAVS